MKSISVLAFLVLSLPTFAASTVVCRVAQLYDTSAFEEALSMDEYSNVSVVKSGSSLNVKVGALQEFKTSSGDRITLAAKGPNTLVTASYKNSPSKVFIELDLNPGQKLGLVSFQQDNRFKVRPIALLTCK